MWEEFDRPIPIFASILIVILFGTAILEGILLYQAYSEPPETVTETKVIYRDRDIQDTQTDSTSPGEQSFKTLPADSDTETSE